MPLFEIVFFAGYLALLSQAVSFHRRCFLSLVAEVPEVRDLKYKDTVNKGILVVLRIINVFIGFPLVGLALLAPGIEQKYRESMVNSIMTLRDVDLVVKHKLNMWARGNF
jgi:hypothetical protein